MNFLDVAKNYGIESLPDLDDIEELKEILTLGVLIKLKEKYKILEKEEYSKNELWEYARKYGQIHVRIWFIESKYPESFIFSRFFYRAPYYYGNGKNFGKLYMTFCWPTERFRIVKITPLICTGMPLYEQDILAYPISFTFSGCW